MDFVSDYFSDQITYELDLSDQTDIGLNLRTVIGSDSYSGEIFGSLTYRIIVFGLRATIKLDIVIIIKVSPPKR